MLQSEFKTTTVSTFFGRELARYGPDQRPTQALPYGEAADYCRRFAKHSYENFTVGSWLLPRDLRQDFYNIYAFCRWSDNLADDISEPAESLRLLDWWQQELAKCFSGNSAHPIMVALQDTINRHSLPNYPFEDLLSAFRQDQTVKRFQTNAEVMEYCRRSANPVGQILLLLAKAASPTNIELSDKICTALQLANFCQDMSRDASMDRIYAPISLWRQHDVDESMLLARQPTPALSRMLQQWVFEASVLFDSGKPLVNSVPGWLAMDLELFVRGGQAVLVKIQRANFDVWSQRPTISKADKIRILGQALFARFGNRKGKADA